MGLDQSLTILDLFAGCGGMTRGFIDKGFEPIDAVEFNLHAAATYAANFGEDHINYGDIADYTEVKTARVVVGGPPCQGFSSLGKRNPEDERNRLWREFVRVVVAAECDVFVMENVDRFAKSAEYGLLQHETGDDGQLKDYTVEALTLNAADFGVAQRRIRTFIVGSRIGRITPPEHTNHREPTGDQQPWLTLRKALPSLPMRDLRTKLPETEATFFEEVVPGIFKLADIHLRRNYQPKSIERYALVPPGGNRSALPEDLLYECWKKHKHGSTDVLGRLEWDKPALTIRTEFFKPEKGRYLHPEWSESGKSVNRALTHAEAARLQGFDDHHVWCGNRVEIARQIGNAVPPPLAAAVAKQVRTLLEQR